MSGSPTTVRSPSRPSTLTSTSLGRRRSALLFRQHPRPDLTQTPGKLGFEHTTSGAWIACRKAKSNTDGGSRNIILVGSPGSYGVQRQLNEFSLTEIGDRRLSDS